ncbi:DUF2252 family protein [Sphingomonas sp. AOB5]|uniref:DUF2252 family protein n=1 Tax=Sphingomonas sp. AOB5 TaxID=3034017 RepID=UPI0023F78608|nr:DUF2252 family protein [Sphingomonas sp. AOB5]MDF7774123.1 DUF2252 family protein [Sphingomonas sp. AOB5]
MTRVASGLPGFAASIAAYEAWMREQLGDTLVAKELKRKHERMRSHPFLFLRATCWRWAEAAPSLCPELMDAPVAPSVGDAHAGNFGLWRDAGARLVWGVNDFDEAARLPWCLDLVRLCASVILAVPKPGPRAVADAILAGYAEALAAPRPFVLERDHLWLRDAFAASDVQRAEFWTEIETAKPARHVPEPYRQALIDALPEPGLIPHIAAREAGAGSLGRPRYVASCEHRGGPLAIEVKGVLPSCWIDGREEGLAARIVAGRFRSPDPAFHYHDTYVLRRLAPNSRKLNFTDVGVTLRKRLIHAMGADLAGIHAESDILQAAIHADLAARPRRWLADAAIRVADWTNAEYQLYR